MGRAFLGKEGFALGKVERLAVDRRAGKGAGGTVSALILLGF